MGTSYPAKAIANYFINKSVIESKEDLTLMKLMKLIYIAHGWKLALSGESLIQENIQAWQFGPVIESIYHEFKQFGNRHIDGLAPKIRNTDTSEIEFFEIEKNDEETKSLLDKIWEVYKKFTGIELSNWSHEEGGPWYDIYVRNHGDKKRGSVISNENIKEYFTKFRKNKNNEAN